MKLPYNPYYIEQLNTTEIYTYISKKPLCKTINPLDNHVLAKAGIRKGSE